MAAFNPVSAAAGGALIGLAVVLLMLFTGRIAGISGIFGTALRPGAPDKAWRLAFLAGLIGAPFLLALAGQSLPRPAMPASFTIILASGLLVGFGTRLAQGCTSGHGLCGIGRLSPRSLAATITFMLTAILTVALMRHAVGG
jgi:uncharacterized membrane protein YedE/YeeE